MSKREEKDMQGCIAMEALGTLDSLSSDDPTRRHVAQCARCSAMLVAYREFMRADAPRAAHMTDADARLASFIAHRVEGVEAGGASRRFGRWFDLPNFRFAAIAAGLVIVALAVARFMPPRTDHVILRGDAHSAFTTETRVLSVNAINLSWSPVADADAYEVIVLGADLSEIVRLPAGSETSLTVDPSTLPAAAVRWQVSALREGAVLVESVPEELRK
jgi:hypothetical protein